MIELLAGLWHAIVAATYIAGRTIKRSGLISSVFMRDSFRAHFNLIAQYTAPFEQEILHKTPPAPRNLNIFGQIVLTPLNAIAWLMALTLAPLVYNGFLLLAAFFIRTHNLALFDLPERQLRLPEGSMPWYRIVYGLGGLITGSLLGLVSTLGIALLRTLFNSGKSAWLNFKRVSLMALSAEESVAIEDARSNPLKYGFGLPGFVLGGLAGMTGFVLVGAYRILRESAKTTLDIAKRMINAVMPYQNDMEQEVTGPQRRVLNRYLLGAPGLLTGALLGTLGMAAVVLARSLANSWYSFAIGFTRIANLGLDPADEMTLLDSINHAPAKQKYGFGLPGLLLGGLTGIAGYALIVSGRIISNTVRTAFGMTVSAGHFAYHGTAPEHLGLETDARSPMRKYVLGFPGLLPGSLTASAGFSLAILLRLIRESSKTTGYITGRMINRVRTRQAGSAETAPRPQHSLINRYLFGAPGLLTGTLFGLLGMSAVILGRSVTHSWYSAVIGFTQTVNLALDPADELKLNNSYQSISAAEKYGFGLPGLLLGGLAGVPGFAAVLFGRLISNTSRTAFGMTVSAGHFALHGTRSEHVGLENDVRGPMRKYALGFPGLFLGSLTASAGFSLAILFRMVRESVKTTADITRRMANTVLPTQNAPETENKSTGRSLINRYLFGAPGIVSGVVVGAFSMVAIILARGVSNSWFSFAIGFTRVLNLALDPGDEIQLHRSVNEAPAAEKYGFGLPGLVLGGLAGIPAYASALSGRIISNTSRTAFGMTVSAGHFALHGTAPERSGLETDVRGPVRKYGLGFPGLPLGFLTASAGFSLAILFRIVRESAKTTADITRRMAHAVLPGQAEPVTENRAPERSLINRYLLGAPGLLSGVALGTISMAAVILARIISNSFFSVAIGFSRVTNLALASEDEIRLHEPILNAPASQKYGFGLPGLLLGGLAGMAGYTSVLFARIVANSIRITFSATVSAGHFAYHGTAPERLGLGIDARSPSRKYAFGFPGLLLGIPTVAAAFSLAILFRFIRESSKTTGSIARRMVNLVRSEQRNLEQDDPRAERNLINRYLFGAPGLLSGVLLGALGMSAVILARSVRDSWFSAATGFTRVTNLALDPADEIQLPESINNAPASSKYGFGLPGFVLGGVAGLAGYTFVLFGRIIRNTTRTAFGMTLSAGYFALHGTAPEHSGLDTDARRPLRKYILGFPGLVTGALTASAGFSLVTLYRIARESAKTTVDITRTLTNAALPASNNREPGASQPERSLINRYLFGAPGILIGGLAGSLAAFGINSARVVYHSALSWAGLSGSLINGSLKQPVFAGLGGDNRPATQKIAGGFGYALALITSLPASALIVVVKTLSPLILAFAAGVVFSPIVAALKWLNMGIRAPRFAHEPEPDPTIGKFQNIYSSLNAWGQLPEHAEILENQNGRKGALCFTRKAITFDVSSLTEKTLETLLQTWRNTPVTNREQFFEDNGGFARAVAQVKEHYRVLSCLEFSQTIAEREAQIDSVGDFVKQYICEDNRQIPARVYNNNSWSAVFWGRSQNGHDAPEMNHASPAP